MNILKGENEVRKLIKHDSFGEQALFNETSVRTMSVKAHDDNVFN